MQIDEKAEELVGGVWGSKQAAPGQPRHMPAGRGRERRWGRQRWRGDGGLMVGEQHHPLIALSGHLLQRRLGGNSGVLGWCHPLIPCPLLPQRETRQHSGSMMGVAVTSPDPLVWSASSRTSPGL